MRIGKITLLHILQEVRTIYKTRNQLKVIGVGMIPRGEVGLIFAQTGLASGVFTPSLFSAVTIMVLVTTFMAPPLLKYLSLNLSHFVARPIWRRRGMFPLRCRAHRLQRRGPL